MINGCLLKVNNCWKETSWNKLWFFSRKSFDTITKQNCWQMNKIVRWFRSIAIWQSKQAVASLKYIIRLRPVQHVILQAICTPYAYNYKWRILSSLFCRKTKLHFTYYYIDCLFDMATLCHSNTAYMSIQCTTSTVNY